MDSSASSCISQTRGIFAHPKDAYTIGFCAVKTMLFECVVNVVNAAFSSIVSAFIYVCHRESPARAAGSECEQNNSLWFIGNRCTGDALGVPVVIIRLLMCFSWLRPKKEEQLAGIC